MTSLLKAPVLVLCLLVSILKAGAQETGKNPTLKESVESIRNLFKKKNGGGEQNGNPLSEQSSLNYQHLKGGSISPNVVYIDADRMTNFSDGKAIIHKGNSTAMINSKGEQVIPFNKYRFFAIDNTYVEYPTEVFANGLFQYAANNNEGYTHFMNAAGKEITGPSIENSSALTYTNNKSLLVKSKTLYNKPKDRQGHYPQVFYYITKENKLFQLEKALTYIRDGIGIINAYVNGGWKLGYVRLTGEAVTGIIFDKANPFNNGMAVVGQKDQYGIMKYGYINEKGKLVVPFMFSQEPGSFSGGFAKVKPKDKTGFEYGYINKQGKLVLTQTTADKKHYGGTFNEFGNFQPYGICVTQDLRYVMDTSFRIQSKDAFFASFGIKGIAHFKGAYYDKGSGKRTTSPAPFNVKGEPNPKIYFSINPSASIGFINLSTKTVVLPAFSRIGYFDPVSGLAYAEIDNIVTKGGHKGIETTKGYINERGEWVILQSKGSQW
ncbi:WG repeat-containing protein [Pseudoflavitalea rhizosphaerae]|uniref:WG repeat-containing protein n=1 Tax=Pseudoflavitalea rhizosphaerae TaxID=1884793 RepID=UPI000F8DC180|nr:WG repeat-containing protein [Pseudoflavitalea rhizosphaerae]